MTSALLKYLHVIALCTAATANVITLTDGDKTEIKAILEQFVRAV